MLSPRRAASRLAPALIALALVSCAVGGMPQPRSAPALERDRAWDSPMRENMPPEYRVFYDMLNGLGDWTLIEPYGYVFRPDVNFVAWRPYTNGYWVPSDAYGWIWVSADPFGWATDHYGRWLNDEYQGWVWVPNTIWGPAWVSWVGDQDYAGWAPLLANSRQLPMTGYTFAPMSALGRTDLAAHVVNPAQVKLNVQALKPIGRTIQHGGVALPAGPSLELVERKTGPLKLAEIQDLVPPGSLASGRAPVRGAAGAAKPTRPTDPETAAHDARVAAQREAARVAAEARDRAKEGGAAPLKLPVMRAFEPGKGARPGAQRQEAPSDSTAR